MIEIDTYSIFNLTLDDVKALADSRSMKLQFNKETETGSFMFTIGDSHYRISMGITGLRKVGITNITNEVGFRRFRRNIQHSYILTQVQTMTDAEFMPFSDDTLVVVFTKTHRTIHEVFMEAIDL